MSSVIGVIPARYGSTRFPGKALAPLKNRTMLEEVWRRAGRAEKIDRLMIATDDRRILDEASRFGAEAVMTSNEHASGTDRVAEVAGAHEEADLLVNLQGDEPELDAVAVAEMVAGMRASPDVLVATLAHAESGADFLSSSDVVKVGVDVDGFATYFSRSGSASGGGVGPPLRHIGVYGFQRAFLLDFASWPPGEAEQRERLEQLRAVERGVRIRVFQTTRAFAGVDTPEQLAALERRGPRSQPEPERG